MDLNVTLCQPDALHICDGSEEENRAVLTQLEEQGLIKKLRKYENWWVGFNSEDSADRGHKANILNISTLEPFQLSKMSVFCGIYFSK